MGVVYGVVAAVFIGASDYLGSRSAGRSSALQAVTAAVWAGAAASLVVSPLLGEPRGRDILLGAVSGATVALALGVLWRAYVVASVGVAAPVAAVVNAVVPVLWDLTRGEAPGPLGVTGMVLGATAIVATSWSTDGRPVRPGLLLGTLAGVAFGVTFIVAAETAVESGTWPVFSQRLCAGVLLVTVALARRVPPLAAPSIARRSAVAGVFGTSGIAASVLGGQRGPIGPVAVGAALYPAVTILLLWLLHGERLRWWQSLGLVAAVAGVALLGLD